MRMSDWSSDVCSSDLRTFRDMDASLQFQPVNHRLGDKANAVVGTAKTLPVKLRIFSDHQSFRNTDAGIDHATAQPRVADDEIGRGSGRERGGQSVWISVVAVPFKKKRHIIKHT